MDFKFASGPINNIIPFKNSQILFLLKEKIAFYDFDLKKGHRLKDISSDVHQIVLIPSCGEVLSLMNCLQSILRITRGGKITTYITTKKPHERYSCVGYTGKQAYACVVHEAENNNNWTIDLSLLDQFGQILMSFNLDFSKYLKNRKFKIKRRIFVSNETYKFITIDESTVELVDGTGNTAKVTKAYKGCVGTSPAYSFSPRDIAVDKRGNILVAVVNDNAIHLLDQTLTFQTLLMTEEDGLHRPTSLALHGQ